MANSKKDFSTGAAGIFTRTSKPPADKADTDNKKVKPSEYRRTYIINKESADNLEAVAYWDRKTIKQAMKEAIDNYVKNYIANPANKANVSSGQVNPIPTQE